MRSKYITGFVAHNGPYFSELIESVSMRCRPEDIAQLILDVGGPFTPPQQALLDKAALHSAKRYGRNWSHMATEFGVDKVKFEAQMIAAQAFFNLGPGLSTPKTALMAILYSSKLWTSPVKLTHKERKAIGCFKNARWYNKRRRLLARIEDKLKRAARHEDRNQLRIMSKTRLAALLTRDDLQDAPTACLVAYVTALLGRRSMFTNKSQVRAYDEVADMLLNRCMNSPTTNWLAIAYVMPDLRVLEFLTHEQLGKLLAVQWNVLETSARLLADTWTKMKCTRADMIVQRGDDSSTWNEAAGAWNLARAAWLNLACVLRMDEFLDYMLPGKVMRVMAADVAGWHRSSGGGVHPDTKVWAKLPEPWLVMSGLADCGRKNVEAACKAAGASLASWTTPVVAGRLAMPFKATPELVHGVVVSSPALAQALKRAGVFSGKVVRDAGVSFTIDRDEHGAAVLAREE